MTGLESLVLPIVVSSIFVFIASSIIHMAPLWHQKDYPKLPNEDKARDALRPLAIAPGEYMVPRAETGREMRSPEFMDKLKQGPVLMMNVYPNGMFAMGKSLSLWFVYLLVTGVFAAYVAGRALPPASHYLQVFRFAGVTAFVGYSLALWQGVIWYRRSLSVAITSTIDGLIYALLTAGTFGWLWPR